MNVLIANKLEPEIAALSGYGCDVINAPTLGEADLLETIERVQPEVLVVRSSKVSAVAMAKSRRLRLVIRAGSGTDNIDVASATLFGIKVCNCPGMNAVAVAELTIGLLLACDRRIPEQVVASRDGRWEHEEFVKTGPGGAIGLKGLTLGVIGVGKIGEEVIKRSAAFGIKTIAWSRNLSMERAAALNSEYGGSSTHSLLSLASRCEALSIHLPLTASTHGIIGQDFFNAMRPGAYFINTSRAGLVNEMALRHAVISKRIRAGLDVVNEQPEGDQTTWVSEIARLPGVFATHYCGASTRQSQQAVAAEVVRIVRIFKETGCCENCVN